MNLGRRGLLWLLALALALALALVAAQALGLMHRVVHGSQGETASGQAHSHVVADADPSPRAEASFRAQGLVADLFGHDADESTCRLFDSLSHGGMPVVPAVALPALVAACYLDLFSGEFLARWAALFDARGPPALR